MKLDFSLYKDAMLTLQNILHHTDWSFESNWETKKQAIIQVLEQLGYNDIDALLQQGYHSDLYQQTYDKINETQRFQTVILAYFLATLYSSPTHDKLLPIFNHHFYINGIKKIKHDDQRSAIAIYKRGFSLEDINQMQMLFEYNDLNSKSRWKMAGVGGSFACAGGGILSIIGIILMMAEFDQSGWATLALCFTMMFCGAAIITAFITAISFMVEQYRLNEKIRDLENFGLLRYINIDWFNTIALDKPPYVSIAPNSTLFRPVSDEEERHSLIESAAAKSLYLKFGS